MAVSGKENQIRRNQMLKRITSALIFMMIIILTACTPNPDTSGNLNDFASLSDTDKAGLATAIIKNSMKNITNSKVHGTSIGEEATVSYLFYLSNKTYTGFEFSSGAIIIELAGTKTINQNGTITVNAETMEISTEIPLVLKDTGETLDLRTSRVSLSKGDAVIELKSTDDGYKHNVTKMNITAESSWITASDADSEDAEDNKPEPAPSADSTAIAAYIFQAQNLLWKLDDPAEYLTTSSDDESDTTYTAKKDIYFDSIDVRLLKNSVITYRETDDSSYEKYELYAEIGAENYHLHVTVETEYSDHENPMISITLNNLIIDFDEMDKKLSELFG